MSPTLAPSTNKPVVGRAPRKYTWTPLAVLTLYVLVALTQTGTPLGSSKSSTHRSDAARSMPMLKDGSWCQGAKADGSDGGLESLKPCEPGSVTFALGVSGNT